MPLLNARWIAFFAASTAVLITLVGVVGWASFQEGISNKDKFNSFGVDSNSNNDANADSKWPATENALVILMHVDSFDPNKFGTLGFRLDYAPINNLSSTVNDYAPVVPVLQTVVANFAAETTMPLQSVSQVMDGDLNRYPFDVFRLDYNISAYSSPDNTHNGKPMPLTMFADGTIQGFKVDTEFEGAEDGSDVTVHVTIRRSPITKAFSIVIIIVMWCLSGTIFVAAMSVFFRERKPELPLIALSAAVLFALPNVRNAQPGIPIVVGTISDMIGFFFNVLLVATSVFALLARFLIMSRRDEAEKKKDKDSEKPKESKKPPRSPSPKRTPKGHLYTSVPLEDDTVTAYSGHSDEPGKELYGQRSTPPNSPRELPNPYR
ncbi:hypothetical protein C8J57DRAFT_1673734 [Mycena rebaudengoi]|nr:hypothetical protein C8J57DRAFT_1673734 [Mycena rebaudengoi]